MRLLKKTELIKNGILDASERHQTKPYPTHMHDFFEIELIVEGSGTCIFNGIPYSLEPGKLFFITPADIHSVETDNVTLLNLVFTGELTDGNSLYRLLVSHSDPVFSLQGNDRTFVTLLMKEIVKLSEQGMLQNTVCFLECLLQKLLNLRNKPIYNQIPHIRKALIYILENFMEDLSLDQVAQFVGISKNYLSELFHKEIGINYKTYLDNIRFDYLMKLFNYSELNIMQAYEKCGFVDYPNFYKKFKERYGMSPTEYRKEHTHG